jgi:hypothetical protein
MTPDAIKAVERAVNRFYPELLGAVKCALAVVSAMAMKGRTKPLVVMFEAPSGFGKSAVVQMFFPVKSDRMHLHVYRTDKFSPKAFVSHAANATEAKLAKNDLLPKVVGKTLLVKEMSPLFRGREEEMRENFAILTAVLDGKGFTSDSGTKGQRGYTGKKLFNWLGATTPLNPQAHRIMYQLGTRMLFYEVRCTPPEEAQLVDYTLRDDADHAEDECQLAVNNFVIAFFENHPIESVEASSIEISGEVAKECVRWACLVAHGRTEVKYEPNGKSWEPVSAAPPEGPWKLISYFKDLARSHALIHGRTVVTREDIELVEHIALSSIPLHLRPIVRRLRETGVITTGECERLLQVSPPTARHYLEELGLRRIATVTVSDTTTLSLEKKFSWLRLSDISSETHHAKPESEATTATGPITEEVSFLGFADGRTAE